MLRSKYTGIIMLLVAGGAVALNWDYYSGFFGGRPAGYSDGSVPEAQSPETAPRNLSPDEETAAPPAVLPVPPAVDPALEATPAAAVQQAHEPPSPIAAAMEKLCVIFDRLTRHEPEPRPRRLTPFHSEAEAEAGIDLESLLNEARTLRAERRSRTGEGSGTGAAAGSGDRNPDGTVGPNAGSAAPGAPADSLAANALAMLKAAHVTCILKGQAYAICVVGGRRLVMGDKWPGTEHKVTEILERGVTFSDGKATIQLSLALPGAMSTSAPSTPGKEGT